MSHVQSREHLCASHACSGLSCVSLSSLLSPSASHDHRLHDFKHTLPQVGPNHLPLSPNIWRLPHLIFKESNEQKYVITVAWVTLCCWPCRLILGDSIDVKGALGMPNVALHADATPGYDSAWCRDYSSWPAATSTTGQTLIPEPC